MIQNLTPDQLISQLQLATEVTNAHILSGVPTWVTIWVMILIGVCMPAFVIAIWKKEARWIALGWYGTLVLTPFLISTAGTTGFWGMTHIFFWPIALAVVIPRIPAIGLDNWYGKWLTAACACMTISLAFDVLDVARFFLA